MSDQDFAQLILDKMKAEAEHAADPSDSEKYNNFFALYRAHRQELRNRQDRSFRQKYPVTQFERVPDAPELEWQTPSIKEQLDDAGFGSFGPM